MVTLKDIAERAGVSMMTVSRVMNGKEGKVSEKTAERIRTLADEMGYIPNSSARSLAARSSQIIAFRLRSWNAEGAIFLGLFDEEVQQIQNSNRIPLILIDSYSNVRQLINIGIDDYKGGQLAADYFFKKGHKTLGFVGPFTKIGGVITKRYQGFTDTLDKHHISLTPDHVYDIEKMEPSEIIDSILQDNCPPSGLFVFSDEIALQLSNIADPDRPSENVTLDVRLVERNSVSTQ